MVKGDFCVKNEKLSNFKQRLTLTKDSNLMSLFPVRCFTCGKVLYSWDIYEEKLEYFKCPDKTLDNMNLKKICCRRMYKGHNPQIEKDILLYENVSNIEGGTDVD